MAQLHADAKTAFDNSPYLRVLYWPFVRHDGRAGIQSRVKIADGAGIVALDENSHEVYTVELVRQTENGPISSWEIPGGAVEEVEPLDGAKRELLEETGVKAVDDEKDWVQLFGSDGVHPIDGLVLTSQHAFLLLRGRQVQQPEVGETREVRTVRLSELVEMDRRNEFHDPLNPYILRRAQDWLAENRPDLLT